MAVEALVAGLDSDSLRMLAGLLRIEIDEARGLFAKALQELGIPALSQRDAAIIYAIDISRKIVRGDLTPQDGAAKICVVAHAVADLDFHEFDTFVYAESELDSYLKYREYCIREIMKEAEIWAARDELPGDGDGRADLPRK